MSDYLFLYGTLLPQEVSGKSSEIIRRLKSVGPATVRGRLYDFGDYPGAILDRSTNRLIKGELFELNDGNRELRIFDEYEEFRTTDIDNSLFVRVRTDAELNDGRRLNAWIYVYNRNPGRARLIRNGVYSGSKAA